MKMETIDFDAAIREAVAATSPAKRDAMIKRVNEATADFLVANPTANATTEPDEDLEAAVQRYNREIERGGAAVHARHTAAMKTSEIQEANATHEAARAFLDRLDQLARFESRRERFEMLCGVVPRPRLDRNNFRLELDGWIFRLERAIAPPPTVTAHRAPRVGLRERIRELIGA